MKQLKRKLSFLLIAVMVLTMNVQMVHATEPTGDDTPGDIPASNEAQWNEAQSEVHKITITVATGSAHQYGAYQIFAGREDEKVLSDIRWGKGVSTAAIENGTLMAALKACTATSIDGTTVIEPFKDYNDAAGVAEALGKNEAKDNNIVEAFSRVISKFLSDEANAVSGEPVTEGNELKYTIDVTGDGYYFIKDESSSTGDFTRYILEVVANVNVRAKVDTPEIDKKIEEQGQLTSANNTAIGSDVKFVVTSKVPNMDSYENYIFNVNDTLSAGLDFNNDVTIVLTGSAIKELSKGSDFYVTTEAAVDTNNAAASATAIKIVFINFIQYKELAGATIEIRYSAKLNENAVIGDTGNPNEVSLKYSNNPQDSGKGDEAGPDFPGGETPKSTTYTYVTGVKLEKVDGDKNALSGASFTISGSALNQILVEKEVYEVSSQGDYYKLMDGTYTKTPPTEATVVSYAGINANESLKWEEVDHVSKYEKNTVSELETIGETRVSSKAAVGADGILRIDGLAAGTYEIIEIEAPSGYNILAEPIRFTITWTPDSNDPSKCTWNSDNANVEPNGNRPGTFVTRVVNNKGTTLPSTGGMGTTIFYAVGSILVLGAAIILIAKKRTSVEK